MPAPTPRTIALISDVLKVDPGLIRSDTLLADLGADSLGAVELQDALLNRFGIDVPTDAFHIGTTVADVQALLERGA